MKKDFDRLRELGKQLAEIAHLPVQQQKKDMWRANNDLSPVRPMVYIDQLPWHEIERSEEMQLTCEDNFLQEMELRLKKTLYRWKHFPCDMVVEPRIDLPRSVHNLNYGIDIVEETIATDDRSEIVSHRYEDQLKTEEDLAALKKDEIWVDEALDSRRLELCQEIFDGILPVRFEGVEIHAGIWDRIAQMRPAEAILYDVVDRPEFTRKTVQKFVDLTMSTVDQCEQLGLLDHEMQYVHCTGAYSDDLPAPPEGEYARSKHVWSFGMAQLFSTISPAMHGELDIDLVRPLYERFGLMYYGCCEPLENKIEIVSQINNLRKISISPWANVEKSAEQMQQNYVLSFKANPAFIATGRFEEDEIEKILSEALSAAKAHNTPIEIILKDVSTVRGRLDYIDRWEKMAMRMVEDY